MTLEQKIREAVPEFGYDIKEVDDCIEYVVYEKPIQLNHVLEYLAKLGYLRFVIDTGGWISERDGDYPSMEYLVRVQWNLKSNLLSDQSEELKNFINELA